MVWLAVVAIVVVATGLYAHWAARRLDRLHRRLDAAAAALDEQLRARADAAAALDEQLRTGVGARLAPAAVQLSGPARETLAAAAAAARLTTGLGHDREAVESALSRALYDVVLALPTGPALPAPAAAVVDAHLRASFARSFHNDAVRDALVVRRRRIVRLLHLAGHAPRPAYFEIDDAPLEIPRIAAVAAPYD